MNSRTALRLEPMHRLWNPGKRFLVGGDAPEAGPRQVEPEDPIAGGGRLGELFAANCCGLVWNVVETDRPARVGKHQNLVVGQIRNVQQRFVAGAYPVDGVAGGVAGGRHHGEGSSQELCARIEWLPIGLQGLELAARVGDHAGKIPGIAAGLGKIGRRAQPEILLCPESVDGGIGESRLAIAGHKPIDVIAVGVTQKAGRDLFRGDADLGQSPPEPAEPRIGDIAKTGIDDGYFATDSQHQEVDVEGKGIGRFADGLESGFHVRTLCFRVHQDHRVAEIDLAVADGPGVNGSDAEVVDNGVVEGRRGFGLVGHRPSGGSGRQQAGPGTKSHSPEKSPARPLCFFLVHAANQTMNNPESQFFSESCRARLEPVLSPMAWSGTCLALHHFRVLRIIPADKFELAALGPELERVVIRSTMSTAGAELFRRAKVG